MADTFDANNERWTVDGLANEAQEPSPKPKISRKSREISAGFVR